MAGRVFINPEDDISAVIAKLVSSGKGDIELVVPSGARILQNIVDAYLLRDAAAEQIKNITIVTNDVMGKIFAERAGMAVINAQSEEGDFFITETMARMADIVPKSSGRSSAKPINIKASLKSKTGKNQPKVGRPGVGTKTATKKKTSTDKSKSLKAIRSGASFLDNYRKEKEASKGFDDLRNLERKRISSSSVWRPTTSKVVIGVFILAVMAAIFVFGSILPKADIIVYPLRETASFNIDIFIDKSEVSVDIERGIIPGEVFVANKSESREFSSTGLEDVNTKARGKITIFNEFSTNAQTFIPSRFQAEDGKIFWTIKSVVVPGLLVEEGKTIPGSVVVDVIAAEPGEDYNINPSRFTMPALKGTERFNKIYALSESAMESGKTGQAVVVSQEDLDNAYGTLQIKITPELQDFKENLPEGLVLWDEAYNEELANRSSDKKPGEPSEKFNAEVNIIARAITFKESDLEILLNEEINSRLSEEQTILPKSKEVTFLKPPVVDYQKGTILATLHIKVDIIEDLNADSFKGSILRKNKQEIKQILPNFKGIERVEVKLWPFWVSSVPKSADRVKVTIFGS